MKNKRKVILYIATSLDGFIATKDDNIDFLSIVQEEGEDYGYADFIKTVDTVIMGRRTYDKVLSFGIGFPHAHKETYIITRTNREPIDKINFYTGDLKELVEKLKAVNGKDIFIDGGAKVVNELLKNNLIDEFYISVIPVLLGDGIPLFSDGRSELNLKLVSSTSFNKGLVQLHYKKA